VHQVAPDTDCFNWLPVDGQCCKDDCDVLEDGEEMRVGQSPSISLDTFYCAVENSCKPTKDSKFLLLVQKSIKSEIISILKILISPFSRYKTFLC